ncbi:MAG TPA: hypothetical protein VMT32_21310 [Bryobacteraceae bacterium]|nr:hypothetical protein [Bryobacteraceae bacterium]
MSPSQYQRRLALRQHVLAFLFFCVLFAVFFAPATLSHLLLAPGDGTLYYLPHYLMPFTLWNPYAMTGFPEAADPQTMQWYAPKILLSWIPGSWNAFVIAAYVLASFFTYLYVRALTAEGFAAVAAGLVFGLCGFMVARLGLTTVIHTAAWVPCMLWVAEEFKRGFRFRWVLIGGIVGCESILAGHPQIALYGFALTGAYVAFRAFSAQQGWLRYAGANAGAMALALMLSCVQTLSTVSFTRLTTRDRLTFAQFSEGSRSIYQTILLLFPWLFGGVRIPFFSAWSPPEVTGYVGFSALVLALIALLARYREPVVLFWAAAGGFALLAALGPATPLGRLIYLSPGFGAFRAPARFTCIFCLAMAVLAAQGIIAITKHPKRIPYIAAVVACFLALLLVARLIGPLFGQQMRAAAASLGVPYLPVSISGNQWIKIPLVSGFLLTLLLVAFIRRPDSWVLRIVLLAGIICDLGTFGWFAEWRFASPQASVLQPPAFESKYAAELRRPGGRWLCVRGWVAPSDEAPPDLASLWRLPALGKYGPLQPSRYRDLIEIENTGVAFGHWWDPADRSIDIAGARLVALPATRGGTEMFKGVAFPNANVNILIGRGCGATASGGHIAFQHPRHASAVGIVSFTGCSTGFEQSSPVLEMRFQGGQRSVTTVLRAGIDTAEWAAACADVAPIIRHRPAEVFSRFPVARGMSTCQGQRYGTFVKFSGGDLDVQSIDYRWLPQTEGVIRIVKLVFLNTTAHQVTSVEPTNLWVDDPSRWKEFDRHGDTVVYENLRAMPRAWMVPETVSLAAGDVKRAIKTSRLPDGRSFDPAAMALIEEPLAFRTAADPEARAWVMQDRGSTVDLQTSNRQPGFLVLGDFYHSDWTVSINGRPGRIFQTNYIQRGVLLPAGQNFVHFAFRPTSFYAGLGVSGAGVLLSVLAAFVARARGML